MQGGLLPQDYSQLQNLILIATRGDLYDSSRNETVTMGSYICSKLTMS